MIRDPGILLVKWLGYEIQTSIFVALSIMAFAAILLLLLARMVWASFALPKQMSARRKSRRLQEGLGFFCNAMTAAAAEDKPRAMSLVRRGLERMESDHERGVGLLLASRIAQLTEDKNASASYAREMLSRPSLEFLASRGLFEQAIERNDDLGALEYARRALRLHGNALWASRAVFEHAAQHRQWHEALECLNAARRIKAFPPEVERRNRAVVLCALALQAEEEGHNEEGVSSALEAVGLLPNFVPAVSVAARLCARTGRIRKGERIVEAAWSSAPHPELVDAWLLLHGGETIEENLKRIERLVRHNREHEESRIALARAHLLAREYSLVRSLLTPLSDTDAPSRRVCLLMSDIEDGLGNRDAREDWLARSRKAPADACWYCDGYASNVWQPICPTSGAFDAMRWGVPADEHAMSETGSAPQTTLKGNVLGNESGSSSVILSPPDDPGPALKD
ncbi:MAG: hypothetical protein OXE98_02505 [Hyphomicrobiales bacterium]|nr:hypothetical protein [Hyphomicrobiales bacterium]